VSSSNKYTLTHPYREGLAAILLQDLAAYSLTESVDVSKQNIRGRNQTVHPPLALLLIDTFTTIQMLLRRKMKRPTKQIEVDDAQVVDGFTGLRSFLALLKSFGKASPL